MALSDKVGRGAIEDQRQPVDRRVARLVRRLRERGDRHSFLYGRGKAPYLHDALDRLSRLT